MVSCTIIFEKEGFFARETNCGHSVATIFEKGRERFGAEVSFAMVPLRALDDCRF